MAVSLELSPRTFFPNSHQCWVRPVTGPRFDARLYTSQSHPSEDKTGALASMRRPVCQNLICCERNPPGQPRPKHCLGTQNGRANVIPRQPHAVERHGAGPLEKSISISVRQVFARLKTAMTPCRRSSETITNCHLPTNVGGGDDLARADTGCGPELPLGPVPLLPSTQTLPFRPPPTPRSGCQSALPLSPRTTSRKQIRLLSLWSHAHTSICPSYGKNPQLNYRKEPWRLEPCA